ncbi:MAG: hypothetical protein ACOYLF_05165 [Blastocatellia bacterium]
MVISGKGGRNHANCRLANQRGRTRLIGLIDLIGQGESEQETSGRGELNWLRIRDLFQHCLFRRWLSLPVGWLYFERTERIGEDEPATWVATIFGIRWTVVDGDQYCHVPVEE